MKTASIRQVRHDLGTVLGWVAAGEEVTVMNRTRPVARLLPPRAAALAAFRMPDFAARTKAMFGSRKVPNAVLREREESRC